MGKLYSFISALLLSVATAFAAAPDSYEWWFDHDVSSAQTGPLSGSTLDLQIDTSNLPKGVHYFNLRLGDGGSIYSPVYRKMFHSFGLDDGALSYEIWYDDNYKSKVSGSIDKGTNHIELDLASLPSGVHYFNCRVGYGDGSWGPAYRKMVLNLAGSVNAVSYEYWIDNDYSEKSVGSLSPGANSYIIDLDGVRKGLHRFNYRLQTGEGIWSAVFTKYFYSASNEYRFTEYEYWLDNDFDGRKTATATSSPVSFEVDLTGFDKSAGAHYFHLRARDGDGDWGPIYHKLIVFSDYKAGVPLIGYRHFLNETDLGYVELERQIKDVYMFDVELPDSVYPSVRNHKPIFNGDKVSVADTDSIDYIMQIRTELGWSVPQKWRMELKNDFSTTAVEMKVNTMQTFVSPSGLEFAAMKFISTGEPLYFRSDIPVALDIYKDGEKVEAITPAQLKEMTMVRLEEGEYFGILYGVEDAEAKNFRLHLMDTPNIVPMPEISFVDGIVTMTCSRRDAEIRYTLDGSDPTSESILYEKPFALDRNAVVKAIALVPDVDITPSSVVELVVDSYKTASPVCQFDYAAGLLTITCATEGASISYAFDVEGPWNAYVHPIKIEGNCIVYAKATFPGYKDSDITDISIGEFKCPQVDCSYNGRYVNLVSDLPGATIYYSVDGSDPMSGNVYSGEFDAMGPCLVKAFARKDGFLDSEVTQFEVSYYADEEHAETVSVGNLEACFQWCGRDFADQLDIFRLEGYLNDSDYRFLNSLKGLRHLDIENVLDARIPDNAFRNSRLISIALPSDLREYGADILSDAPCLSSVVWNSTTQNLEGKLTDGLVNPNVLIYVPPGVTVTDAARFNVIVDGKAEDVDLHYGFPYYAVRDFRAGNVSQTREFHQPTEIGVCRGWETLVLPFQPQSIIHSVNGPAVPFAAWNGDIDGNKPFWLYRSTSEGWEVAQEIEACIPYIISMPNNPDYILSANLAGSVTFSASDVVLGPDSSIPSSTSWKDGTEFEGTFMPVEEEGLLSLNVNVAADDLLQGSTFVHDDVTVPFGAYIRGASARKRMPVFGDSSGVVLPSVTGYGLSIETPAPGMLKVSSESDCRVTVANATGIVVRTLHLKAGEPVVLEGLTRDLYICAGVKVMVK